MKILLIGFTKIKYMPYMHFYLDNIDKKSNEIHLLYWNRDCKKEDLSSYKDIKLHEFLYYQEDEVPKYKKLKAFREWRKYAKNLIHDSNFDFIIVMHTLPAVLILDELVKRYSNRYILDYRDSTYESNAIFKKIIHTIVHKAKATFVSSDAFRVYLPQDERIYTSHNLLLDSLKHRDERYINGIQSNKIRISFWGFIRHEEINKEIIKRIAKDDRFELHYYGREQETALKLKKYAKIINAQNVYFHGEYKPEDRYEIVRNTDIIHNIYCDDNTMIAMGNKYYDGIIFYLPQLCMKDSFMGRSCSSKGIGLECDPKNDAFTDDIYTFYSQLNIADFKEKCDRNLEEVLIEYKTTINIILSTINNNQTMH